MTAPRIAIREPDRPAREVEVVEPLEVGRDCAGELVDDRQISRRHLMLYRDEFGLIVTDLGSANGTLVNGQVVTEPVRLQIGDVISLGETTITVLGQRAAESGATPVAPARVSARATIALRPDEAVYEALEEQATSARGDLTDELIAECVWNDDLVARAGIPIVDVPFVTIGGGLGSFAVVQFLRIAGVPKDSIRILTTLEFPHHTYEYLAKASQITDEDRLRSDSMSRIDNIWGFPATRSKKRSVSGRCDRSGR